jgi:hypothetical protein
MTRAIVYRGPDDDGHVVDYAARASRRDRRGEDARVAPPEATELGSVIWVLLMFELWCREMVD